MKKPTDHPPGQDLLNQVRAGFVMQGTSMKAWCDQQGLANQNVRIALLGAWNGPKAQEIRSRIVKAAKAAK